MDDRETKGSEILGRVWLPGRLLARISPAILGPFGSLGALAFLHSTGFKTPLGQATEERLV
jgi:hypothetical protein